MFLWSFHSSGKYNREKMSKYIIQLQVSNEKYTSSKKGRKNNWGVGVACWRWVAWLTLRKSPLILCIFCGQHKVSLAFIVS